MTASAQHDRIPSPQAHPKEGLTLYTTARCLYCDRVRRALRDLGIELKERDIQRDSEARSELRQARGRTTVPALQIITAEGHERWIGGSVKIARYLYRRFSDKRPPLHLQLNGRRIKQVAWAVFALLALLWAVHRPLLGVRTIRAEASGLPAAVAVSHDAFARVLAEHVSGRRVNYVALAANSEPLRRYVATLERFGPRTRPELFPTRNHRLAYYINSYNALVLLGVVAHWPVTSVRDVSGTVSLWPGLGFFWAQRFVLEGERVNLYDLEHDILRRRFGDARIHAAINCASRSCPALEATPYAAGTLERRLDQAARRLCGADRHVRVDHRAKAIVLSKIFEWFAGDFESHAELLGIGSSMLDWIAHYSGASRRRALVVAREQRYRIRYARYDWSLNRL